MSTTTPAAGLEARSIQRIGKSARDAVGQADLADRGTQHKAAKHQPEGLGLKAGERRVGGRRAERRDRGEEKQRREIFRQRAGRPQTGSQMAANQPGWMDQAAAISVIANEQRDDGRDAYALLPSLATVCGNDNE